MTICADCKNYIPKTNPMGQARCWANYKVELDFVYGETKVFSFCRDININGDCKHYVLKRN